MKKTKVKLQVKTTKVRVLLDAAVRVLDAEVMQIVVGGGTMFNCTQQVQGCG